MKHVKHCIQDFSPHLFWDIDADTLHFDYNKAQIIQRVLEYGLMKDWLIISGVYGLRIIAATAAQLRELEPRTLSFITNLSGLPKESFRCYSTKQSIPKHWNF